MLKKTIGDKVTGGTINCSGVIKCEAVKVGKDTVLSQIIQMIKDASSSKAPISRLADKVSGVFVPIIILLSLITTISWLLLDEGIGYAVERGISVLVISCPCALGLATPLAIMAGSGQGARNGILFKTAASLEEIGKCDIVVFDKTGTLTYGKPVVTEIYTADDSKKFLKLAASIEQFSTHPLAKAVTQKAKEIDIGFFESKNFKEHPGFGVSATVNNRDVYAGNYRFISEICDIPKEFIFNAERLSDAGQTSVFFCDNNNFLGMISLEDKIKEDSLSAVKMLKDMGFEVVMLSGDNEKTARKIAGEIGIDEVFATVLPDEKGEIINRLKTRGKVIMVGDGINDAVALTIADAGIAIGTGTDIAIDAADVVLMNSKVLDVPASIRLSKAVLRNIKQNLFWAFIYNCFGIPLAAGLFVHVLGLEMNPMFGAFAMSCSSICVVFNALRLNRLNIYNFKNDKFKTSNILKRESLTMEKVFKVEGMMCPHCEARVKKTVEEIEGVLQAIPSYKDGTVKVVMKKDLSDEIVAVIESQGYKVL